MLALERRQAITELVSKNGVVQVADIVARFGVSEMTIRRDLESLERKGLLHRVRGGAVSNRGRSYEPPFLLRSADHTEEKKRIGKAAASLIENGDSLMLDVGTTVQEVASNLTHHQNLTIITPSFLIAGLLADHPGIRLIVTGGILRQGELSLVGHLAERALKDFYVDKFICGAGQIDIDAGFTEYNLEDTLVKQAMWQQAKDITVVADSSKFGRAAFAAIAPLKAANRIISDTNMPQAIAQKIRAKGVELILV